jgi:hypothetical protein
MWARSLAALEGVPDHLLDDELLYMACLLHDVGLSTATMQRDLPRCFTLSGALAFRDIAAAEAWDEDRIRRGEEAITLHMNPRVPARQGIEAHFLSRASRLDALGIGEWKVDRRDQRDVFADNPLDPDQKNGFSQLFDIRRHAPRSRARMYWYFGSTWLFRLTRHSVAANRL